MGLDKHWQGIPEQVEIVVRPKNPGLGNVKKPKPVVSANENLPPCPSPNAGVDQGAAVMTVQECERQEHPGFDKARDAGHSRYGARAACPEGVQHAWATTACASDLGMSQRRAGHGDGRCAKCSDGEIQHGMAVCAAA
jgi:hypothetical protein